VDYSAINRGEIGVTGIRIWVWVLLRLFDIFNILLGHPGRIAEIGGFKSLKFRSEVRA